MRTLVFVLLCAALPGCGRTHPESVHDRLLSPEPRLIVAQTDAKVGIPKPEEWRVSGHEIVRRGVWKSPVGQVRSPNLMGKVVPRREAKVVSHLFLVLDKPLRENETVTVTSSDGTRRPFVRTAGTESPFIKVNQVGYSPRAAQKFAYLGGWLGPLGPWKRPAEARTFALHRADGTSVLTGPLTPRRPDTLTEDGTPWLGEETFEMDFSACHTPGQYYISVPGVGRSLPFRIDEKGVEEALAILRHGLFVQRCGSSDKTSDVTPWHDGVCHRAVHRGTFPPDDFEYWGSRKNLGGFTDAAGQRVKVSAFDLISRNTDWDGPVAFFPGGWHDAADYDRRPYHLSIVMDLATVGLADEADWGLNHLRLAQEKSGGVGTWIESVRHPVEGEGMPSEDKLAYALSRATRKSSLAYAAAAAQVASLAPSLSEKYRASALRAWRYAHDTPPATNVAFEASVSKNVQTVYWHEDPELPPHLELKAAVHLGLTAELLSDAFFERFRTDVNRNTWCWSPLVLMDVCRTTDPALEAYRTVIRRAVMDRARKALRAAADQPYRLPRANGKDLAWGRAHPLVAARWLVAAHILTDDARYLAAAFNAYDYHCGCNADGMTLTSGLGVRFPVTFLSLQSTADAVASYVAGITPYRWTYSTGRADAELVHSRDEAKMWPIWRRRANLEVLNVPGTEYTVTETMAPAAAVVAYLAQTKDAVRPPAFNTAAPFEQPGYWALP